MKLCFIVLFSSLCATMATADTVGTWPFQPEEDTFEDSAALDLSYLNEEVAGQSGFVGRSPDGASFVRGDGTPIRFWAVNTDVARKGLDELRQHARFLAKRGVNMVRLHGQIALQGQAGSQIAAIDLAERDRLWQLVAAMKEEGIYTTFSPYYPHAVQTETAQDWGVPRDSGGLTGLIYFEPALQEAYKNWLRETLIPVNPYTGLALKDDPSLAIVQMQNEDSLLFWTFGGIKGHEASLLGTLFGQFLEKKYGSLAVARDAWNWSEAPGPIDGMQDDWDKGVIALSDIWYLTSDGDVGSAEVRLRDQAQFLTETMREWHAEIARFLRDDIGARQLFNAGNWRTADDVAMDDLERYAYTAGDVIGVNRYVSALHEGEHQGWAIVAGDVFREDGLLTRPLDLPTTLRQPVGHPYMISETLWVPPMWQQSEGPILMAAYQALTGMDISYWFSIDETQWSPPQSANGYLPSVGKWEVATPQQIGAFPAAALIFRLGLIDEALPVVIEHRSLDDLWSRAGPLVVARQGYDPNRDFSLRETDLLSRFLGASQVSAYSFLVGPVQVAFGSETPDFIHPELEGLVDSENRVVTSLTRQLIWDWGQGVVTLDAPRAQGVLGALSARPRIELQDVTFDSKAPYASVVVVPLDGEPIARSSRLLVQIGSIARPTGWRASPVQHEGGPALVVEEFGGAPWQVDTIEMSLAVRNPGLSQATALDANGMAMGAVEVSRAGGSLTLNLPSGALYVLLK
ncbi:hypothetical protein EI545_19210 [Tabrizicola piscis]|uniref:Glycoside hydrolase n=2 Tax=Tabrizicola piscis TaxID=2494374 RepID=A0A3S8UAJ8_9RHOB|nr:hypothetical protein EI545_19210 [Tabrizicola piscis]